MEQNEIVVEKENQHSVEVTKNAKGDYAWKIKLYFNDEETDRPIERVKAIDLAVRAELEGGGGE